MSLATQILIIHFASTWFMLGLIWMVQLVHYPLFDDVSRANYGRYQRRHQNRISLIVGPAMLTEAASAILLIWFQPVGVGPIWIFAGIGLVAIIWLSTVAIQVPCHEKLSSGFDEQAYLRLVRSNWIRTLAWSIRGGLTIWMLADHWVGVAGG